MLRTVNTVLPHIRAVQRTWEPINAATVQAQLQQVRWRKRRTDPQAKSKEGRVKEQDPRDPWEVDFFKEKIPHYKSTLRAIRRLFKEELDRKKDETAEGLSSIEQEREQEEEFRRLLQWNNEENSKIALIRREKLAVKAQQLEEEKLQRLITKEARIVEETKKLSELVRKEQEASKSFITVETMDAAIEEALNNPRNYNFLIKKSGEPLLPEDTAWEDFRRRTLEARDQELVDSGTDENRDMKSVEQQ